MGGGIESCVPGMAMPSDKPRSIRIDSVLNGYICEVGCKTVVFETMGKMLFELRRYLLSPAYVENEYKLRDLN